MASTFRGIASNAAAQVTEAAFLDVELAALPGHRAMRELRGKPHPGVRFIPAQGIFEGAAEHEELCTTRVSAFLEWGVSGPSLEPARIQEASLRIEELVLATATRCVIRSVFLIWPSDIRFAAEAPQLDTAPNGSPAGAGSRC